MDEYYRNIAELAKHHLDVKAVKIFVLKKTFCSFRLYLEDNLFVDVCHSSASERKDFFLIADGKRVFGYDNLGGWHRHPVGNPDSHEACNEPSEDAVFEEMKRVVETL